MGEVARADDKTTALKKQVADLQKQLAKLSLQMTKTAPSAEERPIGSSARPTGWTVAQGTQPTRKDPACFNCGRDPGHVNTVQHAPAVVFVPSVPVFWLFHAPEQTTAIVVLPSMDLVCGTVFLMN